LVEVGTERLAALCQVVGFDEAQAEAALATFRRFALYWGGRRVHAGLPEQSDITDDGTPFEFSLAIVGGAPELRFLVEVQSAQPSFAAHWMAAAEVNRGLAVDYDAELERLHAVADLFAPTAQTPRFALWHAVCLTPGAAPSFKVYLNPHARGIRESAGLVKAALDRLGFGAAYAQLPACKGRDSYLYFSLDLSRQREARVKVYTAHHETRSAEIEAAVAGADGHVAGQAREFCEAMAEMPGPYARLPVLTCLSFVQGSARPNFATVHFPVRAYADDDKVIKDRVLRYLPPAGIAPYARTLAAFAQRPLTAGIGMQTYVSLRISKEMSTEKRLTVYLAPELFTAGHAELPAVRAQSL
jgi:DMATS type aromatic prenyltransferase